MAETDQVEKKEDFGTDKAAPVSRWLAEIKAYSKTFKGWHDRATNIIKRYRDERESDQEEFVKEPEHRFNILWSNIQTLQPAIYSRLPEPDIRRRHKDKDTTGRAAATILERAVKTEMEDAGFDEALRAARDDYLLTARGQVWIRYVPTYGEEAKDRIFLQVDTDEEENPIYRDEEGNAVEEPQFDDDGTPFTEGEPYRPVVSECIRFDHIAWESFGHTPAPTWNKVNAVWKLEHLTRDQLIERFGEEKGKQVSLTRAVAGTSEEDTKNYGDTFKRAEVYEIWDKRSGKVIWISPGYTSEPLDEIDDPLELEGFFPCPKPIYGTMTTDSLVPVPDYTQYRSQAEQIDKLTQRIALLTKALRVAGAYNAEFDDLQKLISGSENTLIPVDNWAMFAEKGGVEGAISFLPIKEIGEVLTGLVQSREQLKQDLYEVTGISDIIRGQTDPKETFGAQRIKGQYAGMRIEDRQRAFARFARDAVRIGAEVMAEQFTPDMLMELSGWETSEEAEAHDRAAQEWQQAMAQQQQQQQMGQQMGQADRMGQRPPSAREVFDQAIEVIRTDRTRGFTIDIETDSMVLEDEQEEKQSRIEFIQAATSFLKEAVPAAEQYPGLGTVLSEMLLFGIRGFKTGRTLEASFEQAMEDMQDNQGQQQQQQNPEVMQVQAEIERKNAETQAQQQLKQAEFQAEQERKNRELEAEIARKERELEAEIERKREEMRERLRIERQKAQDQAEIAQAKARQQDNSKAAA